MLKIGEKSGQLEKMLEKTADHYEREVESSVTAMTALLESLIILVMEPRWASSCSAYACPSLR
jgi:general secretion pathway protein F